jgi:hypothetical protein
MVLPVSPRVTRDLINSHWNAESIRKKKTDLHSVLTKQHRCLLCTGTHLSDNIRFTVRGYETHHQDRVNRTKGGILTLVKNTIPSAVVQDSGAQDTEFLGVKLVLNDWENCTVFNVYSPPDRPILLDSVVPTDSSCILAGDLNSHSPSWGYADFKQKGEEVENWIITNRLNLINQPDDPPTYYSRSWITTSSPDLANATDDIESISVSATRWN